MDKNIGGIASALYVVLECLSLLFLEFQIDDSDDDGEKDSKDGDPEALSSSLSDLHFSSLDEAVLASCSPPSSSQSSLCKTQSFYSQKPQKTNLPKTLKEKPIILDKEPSLRETPHPNQLTDLGVDEDPSPCPAYQTRLASTSPLDLHSDWKNPRWSVLPPITPQRGEHLALNQYCRYMYDFHTVPLWTCMSWSSAVLVCIHRHTLRDTKDRKLSQYSATSWVLSTTTMSQISWGGLFFFGLYENCGFEGFS